MYFWRVNISSHEVLLIASRPSVIFYSREKSSLHWKSTILRSCRKCVKIMHNYVCACVLRDSSLSDLYIWLLEKVINIKNSIRDNCESAITSNGSKTRRNCRTSRQEAKFLNAAPTAWLIARCILRCILQSYATMRFSLGITFAIALFFFLSTSSSTRAADSREEKRFVRFDNYKIEAGSIINVPIQCPPDKVKVGNRCRNVI